jgi:tetratricopeptide (TPR) repeat protein
MEEENKAQPDDVKTLIESQADRIEALEKQLSNPLFEKASVSVADMNEMFSNQLNTIEIILLLVATGFGVLGWIGYNNIKNSILNSLQNQINKSAERITNEAIGPLRKEYEQLLDKQEKQSIAIEEQRKEFSRKLEGEHYFALANDSVQEKKYDDAVEFYKKAIDLYPENTSSYINKALIHMNRGEYKEAISNYDKVIFLDPYDATPHYNKACAFSRLEMSVDDILPSINKAISLNEKYKEMAKTDEDFESIRKNKQFRELVGLT